MNQGILISIMREMHIGLYFNQVINEKGSTSELFPTTRKHPFRLSRRWLESCSSGPHHIEGYGMYLQRLIECQQPHCHGEEEEEDLV